MNGPFPMKSLLALLALCASAVSYSQTSYLGLYLQGNKIGYSSYTSSPVTLNGKKVNRSDSKTVMDAQLLGTAMSMQMVSSTWTNAAGTPLRMTFNMSSAGRHQKVDATFGAKQVTVNIDNSGSKSTKTLTIPPGGTIVDDPLRLVMNGTMKPGATRSFYVLDPTTVSFMKNEVKLIGKAKAKVNGKTYDSTLVEVIDPRATMKVYLSGKGDMILAEGPMGMEMVPVSKAVALAAPGKYAPSIDLAYATSLKTDKPIVDPASLTGLKLRISGKNLSKIPNDEHQQTLKDGEAWLVDIHPPKIKEGGSATIAEAAAQKPEWTKASMHIPSDSTSFKALAAKVVGKNEDVRSASLAIKKHVNELMKPNAGIGVLRDASDVLKTKEGVCRDYAILTVTLLRSAGIPARLVSGLVNWDGTFYYHAWAEAWDGRRWIGLDSTTEAEQISASHVKLGDGNVEEAFTFTFLDRAKIEVLGSRRD